MPQYTAEQLMRRCITLASNAGGRAAPNPMVGALLLHNDRIIGEGWHHAYGAPHAEVLCIASVAEEEKGYLEESTLYVSLEPCSHFGKTPPCADLIIKTGIPRVIIGCRDSFSRVNGAGIEKLEKAGVEVISGVEEKACRMLNKRFFTFHEKKRPFITLKWAENRDGYIGTGTRERVLISNAISQRVVHRMRSENQAILVGANTVLYDDPLLDTRLYGNNDPLKIVLDREGCMDDSYRVFRNRNKVLLFTADAGLRNRFQNNEKTEILQLGKKNMIQQVLDHLYTINVQSVLVEGGAQVLNAFITAGIWDEAVVIRSDSTDPRLRVRAPLLENDIFLQEEKLGTDTVQYFANRENGFYL